MNKIINKKEATREWVREFNKIPQSLIERAFKEDTSLFRELTPITDGDTVYFHGDSDTYDVSKVEGREYVYLETYENLEVHILDAEAIVYKGEEISIIDVDYENETVELDITEANYKDETIESEAGLILPFKDIQEIVYKDEEIKVIEQNNEILTLDSTLMKVDYNEVEKEFYGWLPMWSTLWTFSESLDEDWTLRNLDKVAECGFRIYQDDETGDVYLGIDGAGYDFYEAHWEPLYEARGLQWHSEE